MKKLLIAFTLGLLSIFPVSPLFSACDFYKDLSAGDPVSKLIQLCGEPVTENKYWDDSINDVVYLYMYNETDDMRGTINTWLIYINKAGFIISVREKN